MSQARRIVTRMATDWEATLRSWSKPPSESEDEKRKKTEDQIRTALAASSRLKTIGYKVYAKGSYANNTNVRLDYDVDIAVECTSWYYHDKTGAAADVRKSAALQERMPDWTANYGRWDFKNDVETALVEYYGRSAVTRGEIAMRVRENKTTLPADVVPSFEYHYIYDVDSSGAPLYNQGTRVYRDSGTYIHNWSTQQLDRGVAKNNATARRYKRMVRCLKRLENLLAAENLIAAALPSFFVECLVYNVNNSRFNNASYVSDMKNVIADIYHGTEESETCKKWFEVSERKYLFHQTQGWTSDQANDLALAAWTFVNK